MFHFCTEVDENRWFSLNRQVAMDIDLSNEVKI